MAFSLAVFLGLRLNICLGEETHHFFDGSRSINLLGLLETGEYCALIPCTLAMVCSEHNIHCFSDVQSPIFECKDCALEYHVGCAEGEYSCGCKEIPVVKSR